MDDRNKQQFAKRFIELPKEKRVLFLKGLEKESLDFGLFPIVPDVDVAERNELSYTQQRMWFLWQLDPQSAAYNLPSAIRIKGRLDQAVLGQAFDHLIARHDTLRTRFEQDENQNPRQRVDPSASVVIQYEDLSHLSESERELRAKETSVEEARQPFDLVEGPLFRVRLLKLADDQYVLLLTMHHIIADGWSMNVIIEEFLHLYDAYSTGSEPSLQSLPIQYADYALWQRSWLEAGEADRQLDYWRSKLGEEHPVLELPADHIRPATPSYIGERKEFSLSQQLGLELRALASRSNATLFMVLLAGFNILLRRYTGQNKLYVGSPVANRNRPETEGLIGCFINTQVLHTELDGPLTVAELIEQVRVSTLEAQDHQDLPFEKLVDGLKLERNVSHNPLFQVMFNHQSNVADVSEMTTASGLSLQPLDKSHQSVEVDLRLDSWEKGCELHIALTWAQDLFEAETVERFGQHLLSIFDSMVSNPQARIGELPLLSQHDSQLMLQQWNSTQADYPRSACLPQLFEAQVEKTPEAIALLGTGEEEGQSLTYRQLNNRANQLAQRLRDKGVGPEVFVGVATERCMDMVISLLAIMKAGGAYVPLDPAFPKERLAYMLEHSGLKLLLSQQHLQAALPELDKETSDVEVMWLDTLSDSSDDNAQNLAPLAHADNLAYTIYTSGSTGKPKGVAISHQCLVNFLLSMAQQPGIDAQDRVVALTSLSFDIAGLELYLPLISGAGIIMLDSAATKDPQKILAAAECHQASFIQATPSTWKMLLSVDDPSYLSRCKVLTGGEALPEALAGDMLAYVDSVWNVYGPTETTIWSALYRMDKEHNLPYLGNPIANTSIYILNDELEPQPVGVAGDLYIGGEGLARGYQHRPDLTAERFVPSPFEAEQGACLYRTGDLARYRSDGTLEYIGRSDFQVKVRGYRIELGEIESLLHKQTGVQDAAVVAQENQHGHQLVAYIVPAEAALLETEESVRTDYLAAIKHPLQSALPEYMVPAQWMLLDKMPLTPNGKLDRKALPKVDGSNFQKAYEAPATELEQQLAEIWQEVLGLEQVGLNDNFFELGGHSLLLTQVVSRIRQTLALELPLRVLFEARDLRSFAEKVEHSAGVASEAAQAIVPVSRDQLLPLSYAQQRQWVLWQLEPGSAAYHMTAALRMKGELNVAALQQSFDWLFERHEVLRTRFAEIYGKLGQVIEPHQSICIETEQLNPGQISQKGEEGAVKEVLQALETVPFDLSQGPLLRVNLLRISERDHVLALVQHHVVSDRWSMQVMLNELVQAYAAFSRGEAPTFETLPIQYADYAVWQREYLAGDEGEHQLSYWREQLGSEHPVLELPTDHPRPQQPSYQGDALSLHLDASLYNQLQQVTNSHGVTLHMLLLAAFQTLLHRYSGQNDIRVGVPVANRTHLETEHLLGFFVNTQVLRADFNPDLTFVDLLNHTKQATIDAQANQDLPFEQLVEALQPERSLSYAPLFQVMFNYMLVQGGDASFAALDGLEIESLAWDGQAAQFDLTLDVSECPQGVDFIFNYATDLFEADSIEHMSKHWLQLLHAIVDQPSQRVADLPLLDQAESQLILREWNDTAAVYDNTATIHELVEVQAAKTPEAVAVIFEYQELSYGELNQRANRLAHKLRSLGVKPDDLVGICVERSLDMVIGLLATLKTGGAYVPVDPAYPEDRIAYMIDNSGLKLLLTQSTLVDALPIPEGVEALLLDKEDSSAFSDENPGPLSQLDNLAYVIYTSGSTGKPKGVAIAHSNACSLIQWSHSVYSRDDLSGVLAATSLSFDLSVWELFVPLSAGGYVVLAENALALPELPAVDRVRLVNTVPSAIAALHQAGQIPDTVRTVNLAGEALKQSLVDELYAAGIERVYDLYGPSEDTTYSTGVLRQAQGKATIGRPIANSQGYILDGALQPVPAGVIGELYLSGDGLSRGYLGQPGMTAEKYLPNLFDQGGSRLYRTGDLARYTTEGDIEYMGRADHQVKVRGFRIELGEIEARLLACEYVRDGTVLAIEGDAGYKLVAYLVPMEGDLVQAGSEAQSVFRNQLKNHLQASLPDYMVPEHWVFLERLPLTPNGKIDRKALPRVDVSSFQTAYEAPVTELEQQLAEIWQDVLGLEQVGLNDNFFELGGDSIVSLQLVSRARQQGLHFAPKDVFQSQTLSALASVVTLSGIEIDAEQELVSGDVAPIPFQQWFFEASIPEAHHWNQAVLLRAHQSVDAALLGQSLSQLVKQHDALRLGFEEQAESGWQGRFVTDIASVLWQRDVADEAELTAVANEAQRSLDIQQGPLLRAVLFNLPDGEQRLLLAIHHLVVDGVSWRILLEDLQAIYTQVNAGKAVSLPAKTSSVKAWSQQLHEYASSEALQSELAYWQETLTDVQSDLPQDNPAGSAQNKYGQSVTTHLDKTLTEKLLKDAPSAYRTQINDLLLTALSRVICRWTNEDSALIALEGHGREDLFDNIDLTRTVGWFTSLFPVKLTPSETLDVSIKTVKEQLRAVPNKGIGYGILRYLSDDQAQQALAALPEARITFNYLGQFDSSFDEEQGALFSPAQENSGDALSEEAPLQNWLTINGQVYGGELSLNWSFSGEVYHTETVQALADDYAQELTQLIAHCIAEENQGLTPSDFPLTTLNQTQLDTLPVAVKAIDDIYPLAPMQQGMLFHSLNEPEGGAYLNQMRVDVTGLDVERFRAAWQATLDQHDILRAGFIWEGVDAPIQVIYNDVTLPMIVHDWRGREDLNTAKDQLGEKCLAQGFVLSEAPLLRLDLVQEDDSRYHLIYTNHHILMDGWSGSQLFGEVLQRYQGQAPGTAAGRYRDYLAWLQRQDNASSQAFWKEQLATLEEPTLLSNAIQSVAQTDAEGWGDFEHTFSLEETQQLSEFAKAQKVTLNTVLQAAWLLLLQRYTGQDCVTFGATVAGRPTELPGVEQQLGLFINTLPVVGEIESTDSVGEFLSKVQAQNLALREHEHTPLYEIQRWSGQSGSALFDSIMVFENYPISEALEQGSPSGLEFGELHNHEQTNYGFSLQVTLGDQLGFECRYEHQVYNDDVIQQLMEHWINLLQSMVKNSDETLQALSVLSPEQQLDLIQTLNPFYPDAPAQLSVQQQFESIVSARPDAIAVVLDDAQLTYDELNCRANQLAHRLIEAGISSDGLVGVSVERSIEMIVGVMAILKAGGAFVPLDPAYPEDRLVHMVNDSGLNVLLTQRDVDQSLPFPAAIQRIYLEDSCEIYSESNPTYQGHAKNLAYMIFTSGTTGLPKGVGIDQGSLARHVEVYSERLELNANDNVLQYATLNFDTFGEQVFPTLCTGGSVVMRGEELWDHETFYHNLHRYGISVANMTPSMWYQLIKEFAVRGLTDFGNWRRMIVGGEAMPPDALATWQQLGLDKQVQLWNFYGPTEATAASTSYHCAPVFEGDGPLPATVPIGETLKGRSVYIVDADLNLVPTGVIGELVVGGELLARGYHNRTSLTAERFVADPFSEQGGRLYRTGDLARYDANGVIEYLGRTDHQVKIRGFRVELGEIESQLRTHNQVQDTVVIPQLVNGSQQLIAYIVPTDHALINATAEQQNTCFQSAKSHLQDALPDYMVPVYWIAIDSIPLMPNGKVNRKALPELDTNDFQKSYEAPVTALEQQLAAIWQDVLGLERVGLNDNFFELGGDSIVSLQLVSRARQQGLQFTPKDVFQSQTLRTLSTAVTYAEKVIDAEQGALEGHIGLNPMQRWFFAESISVPQHWNQSVLLRLHQTMAAEPLTEVLDQLCSHHDALRLRFEEQVEAGWQGQFVTDMASVLWQRDVADEAELIAVANEAQRSLDIQQGPLLRAVLFNLPDGEQRLLLTIHHLVVDGVSWRILLEDLQTIYTQVSAGKAVSLPAKTSSVKAWSQQLHEYAVSETLQGELEYWQNVLTDVPDDLPQDNSEGSQQKKYVQNVTTHLDKTLTEQLLKEAPSAYRTQINDLLLTALSRVICRWTNEESALIALEGHGREDLFDTIDLTRTVGWFTSLFPVKLTPASTLDTSIKTVKEQLRAVPNKGIGYGILRYLSDDQTQQTLATLPEARITFNYLGQFDNSFDEEKGALFSPSGNDQGEEQDQSAPLGNYLSINGQVYGGELSLDWSFSGEMYHIETVQALADDYAQELTQLIAHCIAEENQGITPSDFPLTTLNQAQLDTLPVAVKAIDDIYPLAPMQQGMLFHSLNEPEGGAYLNQMRVDVTGLDVERFRAAWQATLDQHDILRAGFIWEGVDAPIQVIYNDVTLPMTVHDWRGQDNLSAAKDQLAEQCLTQGFVLSEAPLLRLDLVQEDDNRFYLIYTNHHILMDGWSGSQLFGEVLQRYQGQVPSTIAGRYRDYLAWLQCQDSSRSQAFWTEQLSSLEEPTLLSNAIQSEPHTEAEGWGDFKHTLGSEETQQLSAFAKAQKVTVNTVLQAAWLLLLQRYTGQDCVTFGATVAGRPMDLPGVEQQLGLFINTLPVVGEIKSTDSVGEFLSKVQSQNLALREYEHTPLYDIQRWSGQSGTALFDSIMVFENYPISDALEQSSPSGLVFGELDNHEQTNYGLTLMIDLTEKLSLEGHYDRSQFCDTAMAQVIKQLVNILKGFVQNADQPLGNLKPCSQIDIQQSLKDWNKVTTAYDPVETIPQRFEAQVEKYPEATAVVFEGRSLSYRELNQQANRLAHKLRTYGIGPDSLVGLCVERSLDMMIGLMAIMKAGSAYVPLDPSYPEDRLAYICADSGLRILLTQKALKDCISTSDSTQILFLDDDQSSEYGEENLPNYCSTDNLAYIIYTSGSTGKPKGVLQTHHNVLRLLLATDKSFGFDHQDVWTLFHSYAFDFSVWEIFGALLYGGKLVIPSYEVTRSPEEFFALMCEEGVTVLNQTPSAFRQLMPVACTHSDQLQALRYVIFGGEALEVDTLRPWYESFGDRAAQLVNMYGITETTVHVTYYPVFEQDKSGSPIGEVIDDLTWYVLDSELDPVSLGCTGELYVGGMGLARGYQHRGALTSERFIANPFAADGSRLYRTGDLACYRLDRSIEYIGRSDHQVKIRGFRIELGEIENQLLALAEINDATVLAQHGVGGLQLVAYVIPAQSDLIRTNKDVQQTFVSSIKSYLKNTLPDFMVPAQIWLLEKMPLTSNGKLDRKALPVIDVSQFQHSYVAPVTEIEQKLAEIWQDVLGLERVGVHDNFFELGGHSLLLVRMISAVKQTFNVELPVSELYASQNIKELSNLIAASDEGDDADDYDLIADVLDELEDIDG